MSLWTTPQLAAEPFVRKTVRRVGSFLFTKASRENKVLLLLDGHNSHKSLEALEYAKENAVVLFCFLAYCTHRVQPLDVEFFAPLQTYYRQEIQTWLKQNPGRFVTPFQVAGLFNKADLKAATPANAVDAFAKTGIYPFNGNIFEEWMFQPSIRTDKPLDNQNQALDDPEQAQQRDVEPTETKSPAQTLPSPKKSKYSLQELSSLPQMAPGTSKKNYGSPAKKSN